MAFSFKHSEETLGFTPEQFIMLAGISMNDLGWEYGIIDDHTLEGRTKMGLFSWGNKITVTVNNEMAFFTSQSSGSQFWDNAKDKKIIETLIEYIHLNQKIYSAGELQAAYDSIAGEKISAAGKIVLSKGNIYGTYGLIAANLLMFLLMICNGISFFEPGVMDVFHWGANIRLYTFGGEWWRLVSSVFLHFGFLHLLFNMYALFFIGRYLEPVIGTGKFVLIFLCTGILASLLSVLWAGNRVSAGASGAIFGMYGCFMALLATQFISGKLRMGLLQSVLIFIAFSLMDGMQQGVDNAAHVGGLVSGFLFGIIVYLTNRFAKATIISTCCILFVTLSTTAFFLVDKKMILFNTNTS